MVLVREAVTEDWQALRDIRLAALRDAPDAFGSTYEAQAAYEEADWRRRLSRGGTFLAYVPEVCASEPAGLAGGYQVNLDTVELVSMYVRPRARGRGVGEALVATVVSWASRRNAIRVHLWVTETNSPARVLYERCGFCLTGEHQPLPSNPHIGEVGMSVRLDAYPDG
jgi:GNAT superfamily N-acetyltransferase